MTGQQTNRCVPGGFKSPRNWGGVASETEERAQVSRITGVLQRRHIIMEPPERGLGEVYALTLTFTGGPKRKKRNNEVYDSGISPAVCYTIESVTTTS